jgi:hypothetical protein
MTKTFTYSFEELPLVLENGIQAALVEGEAEISYTRDVWDFTIKSVSLNSWNEKSRTWKCVALDEGNPLHGIIYDRLEHFASDSVQEAIREQLAEDRAEAAEMRAEMRRDDIMMGLV